MFLLRQSFTGSLPSRIPLTGGSLSSCLRKGWDPSKSCNWPAKAVVHGKIEGVSARCAVLVFRFRPSFTQDWIRGNFQRVGVTQVIMERPSRTREFKIRTLLPYHVVTPCSKECNSSAKFVYEVHLPVAPPKISPSL